MHSSTHPKVMSWEFQQALLVLYSVFLSKCTRCWIPLCCACVVFKCHRLPLGIWIGGRKQHPHSATKVSMATVDSHPPPQHYKLGPDSSHTQSLPFHIPMLLLQRCLHMYLSLSPTKAEGVGWWLATSTLEWNNVYCLLSCTLCGCWHWCTTAKNTTNSSII